ncbi:MAG: TerC family protein [Brachymonas sp.]|nr:TerC family protein [Brachymonas sp.]
MSGVFHSPEPVWLWVVFAAIVVAALFIDFVVLRKQGSHTVEAKEAAVWSAVWVMVSLLFNGLLWWAVRETTGSAEIAASKATEFLTGYLIEKSLAVDNIFVFLMIFSYFSVPAAYQKRVLMAGVLGAIIMRTIMILVGGWMLQKFHWLLYVFGIFLLLTGVKMLFSMGKEQSLGDNFMLKLLRRFMHVSKGYDGEKFFTLENGRRVATPLLLVVMLIEFSDVMFAVDSIPAIFAITADPFIVLTSNILAILGLRAMYFLLAAVAGRFIYLGYGLAGILVFIGIKMLLIDLYKIPAALSLGVVVAVLAASMGLSWIKTRKR